MTPSRPEYTKTRAQTGGSFYFLIEKLPKTEFFLKKSFVRYSSNTFCEE
jgi:hypothetical protein